MMLFDLMIKNGDLVTPQATRRADIGITGGKIAAIGNLEGAAARDVYDASGLYVFAGFIDEHVHSRDPGLTQKEDFEHSTMSAAAGGVTTILEMPNSVPPVKDVESFKSRAHSLGSKSFVDFGLWGMVLGDFNTADLPGLAEAGVIGFKFFWGYALNKKTLALVYNFSKSDDVRLPPDEGEIYDAFKVIGQLGRPVAIHAENSQVITRLTEHEKSLGQNTYASFLRSRPSYTEAMTIRSGLALAHATGVHLHILHIAAGEGVDLVRAARQAGQRVTGETCPHYLLLTDEDYERVGNDMKIYPPIREREHQEKLWDGIKSGAIAAVGSDHAPHEEAEKVGDIWSVPAGACGVQTLVPLMLNAAAEGRLTLNQVAGLLSENPARIWGLYGQKGTLNPGADADITIVDMKEKWLLTKEEMYSKNKINPFAGTTVQGRPVATFVRGQKVMDHGKPIGAPVGRLVKPRTSSQAWW
ncbi:allantoinase AllB [Alicyclobacillus mengziensis]|nr:allantoinase AllB [Alicyclobacillus mengziensis]